MTERECSLCGYVPDMHGRPPLVAHGGDVMHAACLVDEVERLREACGDYSATIQNFDWPMTAEELRRAELRYQRAFALAEKAREERNRLIEQAAKQGMTHAQIAEATGLTRSRVGQLT